MTTAPVLPVRARRPLARGWVSADASSMTRKRALRRLSHEQPAAYHDCYEQVRAQHPALSRHAARGRAWTALRTRFPDRYLELYALEQASPGTTVPPAIASKSWQRACARLAGLHTAPYQASYQRFRAQPMSPARAFHRAVAVLRARDPALFTRLLTEEYQRWLTVTAPAILRGSPGKEA